MRYQHRCLLLLLFLILLCSCQPGRDLAGKYKAEESYSGGKTLYLELRSDGKGSWKMGHDDASFTWEDRGTEVWLHLKVGGIVPGSIGKDGSISISLPEGGNYRFTRVAP